MHFDKDFVESFESPFEFALYICMYYGAARMLEFIGQRVIHTFIYNKLILFIDPKYKIINFLLSSLMVDGGNQS